VILIVYTEYFVVPEMILRIIDATWPALNNIWCFSYNKNETLVYQFIVMSKTYP